MGFETIIIALLNLLMVGFLTIVGYILFKEGG